MIQTINPSRAPVERPASHIKANGIHYTPTDLARFLAEALVEAFCARPEVKAKTITILDPSCGNGELLLSLINALPASVRSQTRVLGYDTDAMAVAEAVRRIETAGAKEVKIQCEDFLALTSFGLDGQLDLRFEDSKSREPLGDDMADLIISNPPYVRTQVMGSHQSGALAKQFGLAGRVDLYHAFVIGMTRYLRPNGCLGLLTSNRFLSTQAGASLRQWFVKEFSLQLLIDLGDTKLFDAAVLPAILIANRVKESVSRQQCVFRRVYEADFVSAPCPAYQTVLAALSTESCGMVNVEEKFYCIETGILRTANKPSVPWILSSDKTDKWIRTIDNEKGGTFGDFGDVKVGIKTTADKVFVRNDWDNLPSDQQPEPTLLHPLITHQEAERWSLPADACGQKRVLYPYTQDCGIRKPICFADYPKAGRYLETHRSILEGRKYVLDAGRKWFEIWVPHSPAAWDTSKVAFPDISKNNVFFVCPVGWVVNGDCYWIVPKKNAPSYTLKAILAVANSSLALRYYDVMFHNKLYAGRRRFMSQYVTQFPLPKAERAIELADAVTRLLDARRQNKQKTATYLEAEVDHLVWASFGLDKEVGRQRNL